MACVQHLCSSWRQRCETACMRVALARFRQPVRLRVLQNLRQPTPHSTPPCHCHRHRHLPPPCRSSPPPPPAPSCSRCPTPPPRPSAPSSRPGATRAAAPCLRPARRYLGAGAGAGDSARVPVCPPMAACITRTARVMLKRSVLRGYVPDPANTTANTQTLPTPLPTPSPCQHRAHATANTTANTAHTPLTFLLPTPPAASRTLPAVRGPHGAGAQSQPLRRAPTLRPLQLLLLQLLFLQLLLLLLLQGLLRLRPHAGAGAGQQLPGVPGTRAGLRAQRRGGGHGRHAAGGGAGRGR